MENGDAAWERILSESKPRTRLDSFTEMALAEGDAKPLDPSQL